MGEKFSKGVFKSFVPVHGWQVVVMNYDCPDDPYVIRHMMGLAVYKDEDDGTESYRPVFDEHDEYGILATDGTPMTTVLAFIAPGETLDQKRYEDLAISEQEMRTHQGERCKRASKAWKKALQVYGPENAERRLRYLYDSLKAKQQIELHQRIKNNPMRPDWLQLDEEELAALMEEMEAAKETA